MTAYRIDDGKALYRGTFACPHCGHENHSWFALWTPVEVVFCDTDEGGCDTPFVVSATVTITVTATPRKIEGISPNPPEEVDAT